MIKPWKLVLGAGAACAACCAAPIVGAWAALGIGSGVLAGGLGALGAGTGPWWALAAAAGVAIAAAGGLLVVRRHKRREPAPSTSECGCAAHGTCAVPRS